jgi:hypothetical protein
MIWYVSSKTGGDANDGRTPQAAFKTLARALDAGKAGDTEPVPEICTGR